MKFVPVILSSLALLPASHAFAPASPQIHRSPLAHVPLGPKSAMSMARAGLLLPEEEMITPQGYGFSAPASRILQESGKKTGYHKANSEDGVLKVTEAITGDAEQDVALVFTDSDMLVGLFTEADFVTVSQVCMKDRPVAVNLDRSFLF